MNELESWLEKTQKVWDYSKSLGLPIDENTSIHVDEVFMAIDIHLDPEADTYFESIPGEGGNIGLYRCMDTKKVLGVRLPLIHKNIHLSTNRKNG